MPTSADTSHVKFRHLLKHRARANIMLILKIRKAEVALKDGRLDDAFEQLFLPGVREHNRGQQLTSNLIRSYLKRGQKHLSEGNPASALADYDRASRLGGNQPEIAGLRSAAAVALQLETEKQRLQQDQLRHARELMTVGAHTLCQAACQSLSHEAPATAQLLADLARSQQTIDAALRQLQVCLKDGNLEMAIERTRLLSHEQLKHRHVQEFLADLQIALTTHVRKLVTEGRLEQARCLMASATKLPQANIELQELRSMIGNLCHVTEEISQIDVHQLLRKLNSIQQCVGNSAWLASALNAAEQLAVSLEKLRASPLAQLETSSPVASLASMPSAPPFKHEVPRVQIPTNLPSSYQRFQLNIDEAGSFIVFSQPSVTLGKDSRQRPVDIAFTSQLEMPMMQVVRVDDDYFLYADQPVQINDRLFKDKLLSSGDRVTAAGRIAFRFHKPHAASSTAVLELSTSTRLACGTARRIVLMDEAIVIGSSADSHIVVPEAEGQVIVSNHNGRLELFAQSGWNQSPVAALRNELHPGQPVSLNSVRAVMLPIQGGSAI
jgi:hypothetical protein